jgi:hypothetical protein
MGKVGPVAPRRGGVPGSGPQTRYGAFFVVAMPTPWGRG